ncbi:MAG: phosphodiester glycosidase family protein [Bacillota bacterium]|nr:phosphodiester glycosidase family protein [Bacillota bacterium]
MKHNTTSNRRSDSGRIEIKKPAQQLIGRAKRRIPLVWFLVADVLISAMILLIFSLFYFILPQDLSQGAEVLPTLTTSDSRQTGTATTESGTGTLASTTLPDATTIASETTSETNESAWGAKFPGRFTGGKIEKTATSYRSSHVSLTIEKIQKDGVTYYLSDVYITDLKYFQSAFADDTFGKGYHKTTDEIARQKNAILAVNGDYYGNNAGPVVRNGTLYREQIYKDVLVMYLDGSMQTFTVSEFDLDKIKDTGVWQIWTFGPMLLSGGQPMQTFNSSVNPANPRTAIGYYEPGHYCFVVVDGRQPGYSNGYSLKEMSQLFYNLGCKVAFNLDGGQSSEMAFLGQLVNQPYKGGREISDIVMIVDEEEELPWSND